MHPRVALMAVLGVATDLLCLLGAAAVLLTNNVWLMEVGATRFLPVVSLMAIVLVPMMYSVERATALRAMERRPEPKPRGLPAWAGAERSATTA